MRYPHSGRHRALAAFALAFCLACNEGPASPQTSLAADAPGLRRQTDEEGRGPRIPFAKLKLFFEFNSTDNDLGVQLLLDGEPWGRVSGFDPSGRKIVEFLAQGRMQQLGLTELFFESAEPSPREVLDLFPAGEYRFTGRTIADEILVGAATLSENLPPAPVFIWPANSGAHAERDEVVIRWRPISGLASYQVIVANSDLGVEMAVDLRPSVTRLKVPKEFLQEGTEYDVEVLAIGTNGNKTITQSSFVTDEKR
jgi:hypothetical protein